MAGVLADKSDIEKIRRALPQTRIILMAIFPRGQSAQDSLRSPIKSTNSILAASARIWNVELIDIGSELLEKDGSISKDDGRLCTPHTQGLPNLGPRAGFGIETTMMDSG
jgi:hypothetical protein